MMTACVSSAPMGSTTVYTREEDLLFLGIKLEICSK
jgi:hypothetical protein